MCENISGKINDGLKQFCLSELVFRKICESQRDVTDVLKSTNQLSSYQHLLL